MNKQAVVLLFTAAFMTFAGCVSNEAQTDMTDAPQEIETAQTENDCETDLKDEIEKQIALEKYGSAVKLAEDNAAVIEADRGKYDDVMDDILIHFTQIANNPRVRTAFIKFQQTLNRPIFRRGIYRKLLPHLRDNFSPQKHIDFGSGIC